VHHNAWYVRLPGACEEGLSLLFVLEPLSTPFMCCRLVAATSGCGAGWPVAKKHSYLIGWLMQREGVLRGQNFPELELFFAAQACGSLE